MVYNGGMEKFSEYLDRLMRQKNLSPKELSRRSGITDSYIGRICKGQGDNLTVDTILKLAKGLQVDAHEMFAKASGVPVNEQAPIHPLLLLDQILKIISDPVGAELLRQLSELSPDERKKLLAYLAHIQSPQPKPKKRR
jgi:transcriptional regulator with XRE-family HTH domain